MAWWHSEESDGQLVLTSQSVGGKKKKKKEIEKNFLFKQMLDKRTEADNG